MRIFPLIAALLTAALLSGPLAAQDPDRIDYDAWAAVAERAEAAVEAGRASDQAFESLRAEVVVWRDRFLRGQDANAARIETLRAQLQALGPAPAEGATEAEEIAARRSDLADQLARARAPVKAAEEAFSRADGIVREIAAIIRERQTEALLNLGPMPLNPALWPAAAGDLAGSARAVIGESREAWASEIKQEALRDGLPRTLLLLAVSVLLLLRGRRITAGLAAQLVRRASDQTRPIAEFTLSLGQIAVPVAGIYLLVAALESTGLLGFRGSLIAGELPFFGFCVFGARWLGLRFFPRGAHPGGRFHLAPEGAGAMRLWVSFLGVLVGLERLLSVLAQYDGYSDATRAVLLFPVAALAGFALWRIGRTLLAFSRAGGEDEDEHVYARRWLGLMGRVVLVLSLLGVGLAGIGYLEAGLFLLFPTVVTLALFGALLLLNDLLHDLYALAIGAPPEEARAALVPTLLGLVVVIVSLPVFALIWGARTADLTELWAQFRKGVTLGETRISPENFLTFVFVFGALYLATRVIQGALRANVLPKTRIDPGGQTAIVSGIGYVGIFLAAILAITAAGINLSSLAIVAGALSVGIGFGLQNIVQNFVSGIILLIERPVSEGDWIEVGGYTGIVRDISVRSTRIETFDRTDVIVPNGDFISGSVVNWTRGNVVGRVVVPVGVAYGTDTRKVERILREIAEAHPQVAIEPPPGIDFIGFGASSLDFQIRAVIRDINFGMSVRTELRHQIAERFAAEEIEIPFAQQDIWLRNPETLRSPQANEVAETTEAPGPEAPQAPASDDDAAETSQ